MVRAIVIPLIYFLSEYVDYARILPAQAAGCLKKLAGLAADSDHERSERGSAREYALVPTGFKNEKYIKPLHFTC
ncbi:hypothetical protein C5935_10280 [Cronobacter sakazakii]|nr:hypothetical protein [Cronobacter sakazakii]KAB1466638.1 hypothetical protein FZI46_21195 [Cronobacter sakazakii]PPY06196.1 hypothetical protein C3D82_21235 [Cronobacter sakazakii]PQY23993.1 hypothetical protein C5957_00450 [Cronobacter sakazakii]PQY91899.1 hypothetical protein C5953_22290 [Cronobacter sakazakii]